MAHLILAKNPNMLRVESDYLSKIDESDILSSFLYLINFLATNFVEVKKTRPIRRYYRFKGGRAEFNLQLKSLGNIVGRDHRDNVFKLVYND